MRRNPWCGGQPHASGRNPIIARGQWAEISRWLQGNGIDPAGVRWFIDIGESRDKLEHPPFNQLQAAIFTGAV